MLELAAARLTPIAGERALAGLVTRQPFQTVARKPAKPSDITNLMLVGTLDQVQQAFKEAGWSNAAALNTEAKLESFRAIAEQRGYSVADMGWRGYTWSRAARTRTRWCCGGFWHRTAGRNERRGCRESASSATRSSVGTNSALRSPLPSADSGLASPTGSLRTPGIGAPCFGGRPATRGWARSSA